MFSDKMIVGGLLLGWRAVRVLGLLLFGGRNRSTVEATLTEVSRPRRARFRSGLTWTMILALLTIGVPLANTDREFKERASRDIQVIAQLISSALRQAE